MRNSDELIAKGNVMNIVVIDDSPANQASAKLLEEDGHTVTVIGTVGAAYTYFEKLGSPWKKTKDPIPDAVLTDLWMPAPKDYEISPGCHHKDPETRLTQMPAGLAFAIIAKNLGVKYVAILTDSDDHSDQMVAILNLFSGRGTTPGAILKEEARGYSADREKERAGHGITKDWKRLMRNMIEWRSGRE